MMENIVSRAALLQAPSKDNMEIHQQEFAHYAIVPAKHVVEEILMTVSLAFLESF